MESLIATNAIAAIVLGAIGYYDLTHRVVAFKKKGK